MSDFDLASIALDMPLKEWLGLWDKERIKWAKNSNFMRTNLKQVF